MARNHQALRSARHATARSAHPSPDAGAPPPVSLQSVTAASPHDTPTAPHRTVQTSGVVSPACTSTSLSQHCLPILPVCATATDTPLISGGIADTKTVST
jgi:hypothetical protein